MEVLHSLWLPAGRDRPVLRVYMYARGNREEAENHYGRVQELQYGVYCKGVWVGQTY